MTIRRDHVLLLDLDGELHPDAVYLSRGGPALKTNETCSFGFQCLSRPDAVRRAIRLELGATDSFQPGCRRVMCA